MWCMKCQHALADSLALVALDGQHTTKLLFMDLERKGILPKGK